MLLDHTPFARTRRAYACIGRTTYDTYIYIYTYIYQKNSAVQLTSVGLAQARPNDKSTVRLTSVGLAKARPNEKSTVQLTSVGLAQARPNYLPYVRRSVNAG